MSSNNFISVKTITINIRSLLNVFHGIRFLPLSFAILMLELSIATASRSEQAGSQTKSVSRRHGLNWGRSVYHVIFKSRNSVLHNSHLIEFVIVEFKQLMDTLNFFFESNAWSRYCDWPVLQIVLIFGTTSRLVRWGYKGFTRGETVSCGLLQSATGALLSLVRYTNIDSTTQLLSNLWLSV